MGYFLFFRYLNIFLFYKLCPKIQPFEALQHVCAQLIVRLSIAAVLDFYILCVICDLFIMNFRYCGTLTRAIVHYLVALCRPLIQFYCCFYFTAFSCSYRIQNTQLLHLLFSGCFAELLPRYLWWAVADVHCAGSSRVREGYSGQHAQYGTHWAVNGCR